MNIFIHVQFLEKLKDCSQAKRINVIYQIKAFFTALIWSLKFSWILKSCLVPSRPIFSHFCELSTAFCYVLWVLFIIKALFLMENVSDIFFQLILLIYIRWIILWLWECYLLILHSWCLLKDLRYWAFGGY